MISVYVCLFGSARFRHPETFHLDWINDGEGAGPRAGPGAGLRHTLTL